MKKNKLADIKLRLEKGFDLNVFLQLTDYITEVILEENKWLHEVKINEVDALQSIKSESCSTYASVIKSLKSNAEIIAGLTVQERQLLKEVSENLSHLLDRNERMIKAFNEANKKVIEIFYNIFKSSTVSSYGRNGKKRSSSFGASGFSNEG